MNFAESAWQSDRNQEGCDPGFKALPSRPSTARYDTGLLVSLLRLLIRMMLNMYIFNAEETLKVTMAWCFLLKVASFTASTILITYGVDIHKIRLMGILQVSWQLYLFALHILRKCLAYNLFYYPNGHIMKESCIQQMPKFAD